MDSSGNFNLEGSKIDVVPVGEPVVAWCGVGQRPVGESMTYLFDRFSQKVCRGTSADFFVSGRSFFAGKNIEQFGVQFYRRGDVSNLSRCRFNDGMLRHLRYGADGRFLFENEAVDARPVGKPVVAYCSINLRRNPSLYPIELADFAKELGFGDKPEVGPNAFTLGNLIDPDGISYVAAQFYRI